MSGCKIALHQSFHLHPSITNVEAPQPPACPSCERLLSQQSPGASFSLPVNKATCALGAAFMNQQGWFDPVSRFHLSCEHNHSTLVVSLDHEYCETLSSQLPWWSPRRTVTPPPLWQQDPAAQPLLYSRMGLCLGRGSSQR